MIFIMLLSLYACAGGQQGEAEQAKEPAESQSYLSAETRSSFPLGLDARVQGIAATDKYIFIGGIKNEAIALARIDYSLADGSLELGEAELLALPDCPEGTQLMGLSCANRKLYVLLGIPEEGSPVLSCHLLVYSAEGNFAYSLALEYTEEESPLSILALEDGSLCLRGIHHLNLYSADGELITALEQEQQEFYPPLLLDGQLVIWLRDPETGLSTLNALDGQQLQLLKELMGVGAPKAYMQSVVGNALVSNGVYILRINTDYELETVLEWYPLMGDYGHSYRYVCQLDETIFLMAAKDSDEVKQLVLANRPDDRRLIRLGFYGVPDYMGRAPTIERLTSKFSRYNPNYKVEAVDYGNDADGMVKLLAEISSGDGPDLVVSAGNAVAPSSAFMDLYEWIDRDEELNREDFLPLSLDRLEKNGQLKQVWSGFSISSRIAKGPLAEMPGPLRLVNCQSYLDSIGYEGILFSTYVSRGTLLSDISYNLLSDAYQKESGGYCLNRENVREFVNLCCALPAKSPLTESVEEEDISQVLSDTYITLGVLNRLEKEQQPYRLFDGTDGGDNFTVLYAPIGNCFMIPVTCRDPQNAWEFLRTMLLNSVQLKDYVESQSFYPTNAAAFNTVMESYTGSQTRVAVSSLLKNGVVCNYDSEQLHEIFLSCMEPCLYGDYDIDIALDNAEGRMNIYASEHMG